MCIFMRGVVSGNDAVISRQYVLCGVHIGATVVSFFIAGPQLDNIEADDIRDQFHAFASALHLLAEILRAPASITKGIRHSILTKN